MTTTDHIALAALAMAGLAVIVPTVAVLYSRRQTIATERTVPQPPPPVAWIAEFIGSSYRLRNVGTDTATGVRLALPEDDDSVQARITDGTDVVAPQETRLEVAGVAAGRSCCYFPVTGLS
uniref:hypothetical protein n=1 Tax=Paractinoplanes polyasparticus TaxID=2856853 RepID=UPI001C860837|nr:hypothetical protein [Actinoplanes polyasparticus]